MTDALEAAHDARAAGRACALCSVVRTSGSTPRKAGAKMVVFADGSSVDTIGGGRVEKAVIDEAVALLASASDGPRLLRYHLTRQLAMCCGGEMDIFVEPLRPPLLLVICGGGHVGTALLPVARSLGFGVRMALHDDEPTPAGVGEAELLAGLDVREWKLPLDGGTFVVVVTRDHAADQKLIEQLLPHPLGYVGLIGAARKIALFRKRLELRSDDPLRFAERWARLHAPIGLAIGAQTPAEIAVAIAAQLVQVRAARNTPPVDAPAVTLVEDDERPTAV